MIAFFAALTVLDALVLWTVITMRGHWVPRATAVLLATAVNGALLVTALPGASGAATTKTIPEENQFLACTVDEPKAIYFWLVVEGEPKGYRQPYSSDLQRTCSQARQAQKSGAQVGIRRRAAKGHRTGGSSRGRFVPYVLPPSLPPKS